MAGKAKLEACFGQAHFWNVCERNSLAVELPHCSWGRQYCLNLLTLWSYQCFEGIKRKPNAPPPPTYKEATALSKQKLTAFWLFRSWDSDLRVTALRIYLNVVFGLPSTLPTYYSFSEQSSFGTRDPKGNSGDHPGGCACPGFALAVNSETRPQVTGRLIGNSYKGQGKFF